MKDKFKPNKATSSLRWLILFLNCIMMIGNYYCYDIPAALHLQMDDFMGRPHQFEVLFSLLYTVYSVPNIVLPFFGGYIVDILG
jgi:MFS family permease